MMISVKDQLLGQIWDQNQIIFHILGHLSTSKHILVILICNVSEAFTFLGICGLMSLRIHEWVLNANISMWDACPEAMAWKVGAVHSDFNLGERIWRSGPQRANLKVYSDTCPFGATSQDTVTEIEIWVHSNNILGHCLWIDTLYTHVWAAWNFHFLMCGPCFEVRFPPAKILSNPFFA